jgi:hypothetical protein
VSLDAAARRRYARQLLLGEIDEAGQARLLEARFHPAEGADADAFAAAADYLERAGCAVAEDGAPVVVPDEQAVLELAGNPSLRAPAAALIGAFSAVEHLKEALGMGEAQRFPSGLRLVPET